MTFAIGPHVEFLDIARPSFQAFARKHGYHYIEAHDFEAKRPPPWYKVPLLKAALRDHDEAVFIGADLVIVDGMNDFAPYVPAEAWQAMVKHHTGDGEVPNDDLWFVRKEMIPWLDKIWAKTEWLHHGWWEQAALLDLMGYSVPQPTCLKKPTELYERTHWLDPSWNVHKWHQPQPEYPLIQHATMYPDRAKVMREWAKQAERWIRELY